MKIEINTDLEDPVLFKRNFFYGLNVRETISAGAAFLLGAAAFLTGHFVLHLPQGAYTLLILVAAIPPIWAGFGKQYGYTRPYQLKKKMARMACLKLYYVSTEDPESEERYEFLEQKEESDIG